MATRFGAVNPAQSYASRVKLIVIALAAVILMLVVVLIMVSMNTTPTPVDGGTGTADGVAVAAPNPNATTIDILTSIQRIEEGAKFDAMMFGTQPVLPDRIPEGAILARDKDFILGKFAKVLINANLPIVRDYISETKPISALNIPPGYRAVTITVDSRTAVEGWARPNTRVDVLWTYQDRDGVKKVATIVRFTKILSVGGATNAEGKPEGAGAPTTITLLVGEKEAKKIELARTLGSLSLSLVGDQEDNKVSDTPDVVTIDTILGTPAEKKGNDEPNDGVMYTQDPKTGKQVRYVLRNGRWVRDTNL